VRQDGGGPAFPTHFDGRRFFNPNAPQVRGFLDLIRWTATSQPERSAGFVDDVRPSKPPGRVEGNELRVTLVNHSTVLLQHRGGNILTDPIWSLRASPVPWAGPRRRRAPGVLWEDLPPIDLVLLSHNHYDHLDVATLRRLAERGPLQFVVPVGVERLVRGLGRVEELDWGNSAALDWGTVHCVPALHFSARGLFDRNRTLWCGYVMKAGESTVYFAGDTAFGPHFAQIRERFGRPRLALLPIGAYEPRWFMLPVHMGPEDAVRAHEILDARTSIAIHHGTFQLGDEAIDTPRRVLRESTADDSFLLLKNGESVTLR
jgi:L-ascorbate metabolism protein UlaG (beta-lactamase superfamily)